MKKLLLALSLCLLGANVNAALLCSQKVKDHFITAKDTFPELITVTHFTNAITFFDKAYELSKQDGKKFEQCTKFMDQMVDYLSTGRALQRQIDSVNARLNDLSARQEALIAQDRARPSLTMEYLSAKGAPAPLAQARADMYNAQVAAQRDASYQRMQQSNAMANEQRALMEKLSLLADQMESWSRKNPLRDFQ